MTTAEVIRLIESARATELRFATLAQRTEDALGAAPHDMIETHHLRGQAVAHNHAAEVLAALVDTIRSVDARIPEALAELDGLARRRRGIVVGGDPE